MAFVGIDLGTTTSEVAIYRDSGSYIISLGQGEEIIPSVVTVDNKTRKPSVGERAKSLLERDPTQSVSEVKRKMGSTEKIGLGPDEYLPHEISSMILKHLKERAEDHLGEPIDRAVITVPANFPDTARQATKTAGELAGLKVERIINEPTAAALAYGVGEGESEETVLVYDLGGGTFDVSVVEYVGSTLDVLASAGDPHLGGKDFDRALMEHVAEAFQAETGVDLDTEPSEGTYFRLLHACEQAKKELSFNTATTVSIPFFTVRDGHPVDLDVEVSRVQFERLVGPMIDRTEQSIDRALKDAGLSRSDVDRTILVGGSTRIPYVRELVERVTGKKPLSDVDPDRAVALGAAVQAAIIDGEVKRIIMDVCPLSLGTAVAADVGGALLPGLYSEIIEPNTKLLKRVEKSYYTIAENQRAVNWRVYQRSIESEAEWAEIDDEPNSEGGFTRLAEREISLTPGPPGQVVKAAYTYNLNGILEVEVEDAQSGRVDKFEVTTLQSSQELSESKKRLQNLWQESDYFDDVRATLHAAESKLDGDLEASARNELEGLIAAMKKALADNDRDEVRRFDDLLTDLLFDLES